MDGTIEVVRNVMKVTSEIGISDEGGKCDRTDDFRLGEKILLSKKTNFNAVSLFVPF